ncbi:MAG: ABC transporter ATP-binding protein [Azospirillaceae bacterium]|nr:ABC transporter ATP-binding protein [Azospirillaceae bacterium]
MAEPLFQLSGLTVDFATREGPVRAVRGVDLAVGRGECLGVVGESGSGKSQLFLAALGLSAANARVGGSARFDGQELLGLKSSALNRVRGTRIALVFQDGGTALTPHLRIGRQMAEGLVAHRGCSWTDARRRCLDMLSLVRIPDAARRLDQYPHELSGGMRQRVLIAMALLCDPDLLIADEPTTALDVTVQAQVLDLLADLRRDRGMAVVLITHDLGTVAGLCDRVAVMYAGRLVESGPVAALFDAPAHPYTRGLLASVPRLDGADGPLATIPGQPPDMRTPPLGCAFAPRCAWVGEDCRAAEPPLLVDGVRSRACHRAVAALEVRP